MHIDTQETQEYPVVVPKGQRDYWLLVICLVASLLSSGATIYYMSRGELLLYNDAFAHLLKARAVFDSLTPGLEQMGDVWLPVQHMFMLPFIWNDTLWQTGLAGTLPSMISYVVAAGYLFCTLRRLTKQPMPSFVGVILFLCNPNVLYLQATPLTEVMCTAGFIATLYYLLRFLQDQQTLHLVSMALAVVLTTLIRYDGWALFLVISLFLGIRLVRIPKQQRDQALDQVIIYLAIAPLGILFWLLWNLKLSGDPLYFYRGPYSAQTYQLFYLQKGELPTYHNFLVSLWTYSVDVGQTLGWGLCIIALLSLVFLVLLHWKRQELFFLVILLVPFVFYVTSLYSGSSIIELPGAGSTTFFNVRYGAQMVLPAAFLCAWGSALLYQRFSYWPLKTLFVGLSLICIGVQALSVGTAGILALQDGLTGISCNNPAEPVIVSLSEHYSGGYVLTDEYTSVINPQLFGAHFRDIIYEGSGSYWQQAIVRPEKIATWVVLNPKNTQDTLTQHFLRRNAQRFLTVFRLVTTNPNGLQLYYRVGAASFPTRPVPGDLLNRPHTCKLNQ